MQQRRIKQGLLAAIALLALVVLGCAANTASVSSGPPPITGAVRYPESAHLAPYSVQATISDIASASTISLIDTVANTTRGTTLTSNTGTFTLTFSNGFKPTNGTTYYLEAFRGLYSNAAGKNAARLRTLMRFQNGGWLSLNASIPGSPVFIDEGSTALSIIANLEGSSGVNPSTLMGTLNVSNDAYTQPASVPTVQSADYATVRPLVVSLLTADSDPVAGIAYTAGPPALFYQKAAGSAAVSIDQASASVGDLITVRGVAFDPTLPLSTTNVVLFNNLATGSVTSISSDRQAITVLVPTGAVTGPVTIRTGGQIYGIPSFTVSATLNVGLY